MTNEENINKEQIKKAVEKTKEKIDEQKSFYKESSQPPDPSGLKLEKIQVYNFEESKPRLPDYDYHFITVYKVNNKKTSMNDWESISSSLWRIIRDSEKLNEIMGDTENNWTFFRSEYHSEWEDSTEEALVYEETY